MTEPTTPHRVVVIGSGFGGLFATKTLRRAPVQVTLIDRTSHHLFQPLLYQLATGILSEGEIAPPTREVLRRQKNARVLVGEVTGIDLDARTVTSRVLGRSRTTPYDSLVVAAGSGQSYFGNDGFAEYAPSMKSIDDALRLRARIFGAYELAELEEDEAARTALLTFVVVGGGPTGVEMAGQLAELARRGLRGEFRSFDSASARVLLVEAGPALLNGFGERLSARTKQSLEKLGVEVRLDTKVVGVDAAGVDLHRPDGSPERVRAATKVWAAGVAASPLGGLLAGATGLGTNRSGQLPVEPDLSLRGHPEVFVVGDMMQLPGKPAVAQVAIQGGRFAARRISDRLRGRSGADTFRYHDKGMLATISRFRAVASVGPIRTTGFWAWILWLVVHLMYLIGFRNRLSVLMHWAVSFVGRGRAERTVTLRQAGLSANEAGLADHADEAGVARQG
ncbi:NAD(P)/FAD-dependent oxidoreductase [Catenulispora yoronensis]|uniref:NADH:ubiquinone reductase (non-electrogenic) n=1 Tax=Catenulispora yoronensis TaxID=450799 RepID=A0ABP5GP32_9ACTN